MKLALNSVQFSNQAWTAKELGLLKDGLEAGDSMKFSKKNIASDKLVTVLITEKGQKDPNKQVVCSGAVSKSVRAALKNGVNQGKVLKYLIGLRAIQNDKGVFLVNPVGGMNESFTFEEVEKIELAPEELIAW